MDNRKRSDKRAWVDGYITALKLDDDSLNTNSLRDEAAREWESRKR